MDATTRALYFLTWAAAAGAHAGLAVWALWIGAARDADDAARVGLEAHPAAAHWFTLRLVWLVLGAEAFSAAAGLGALGAGAAWPGAAPRGMYVFFWVENTVASAALAVAFLAWTGVVGAASLLAMAVATAFAPAALLGVAEYAWAAAALRQPARWDRSRDAGAAWGALGFAALLAAASAGVYVERAVAATVVRGDAAGYAGSVAGLLAGAALLPVAWAAARHALDGYFTPAKNVRHGAARAACTAALRVAAAAVLLAGFVRHARSPLAAE